MFWAFIYTVYLNLEGTKEGWEYVLCVMSIRTTIYDMSYYRIRYQEITIIRKGQACIDLGPGGDCQ